MPLRRALALGVIAALAGLHWVGPVFGEPAPACCKGGCTCCRRTPMGPAWSARPGCAERCGCSRLGLGQAVSFLPPRAIQIQAVEGRPCTAAAAARPEPHSFDFALLYQRPPPARRA